MNVNNLFSGGSIAEERRATLEDPMGRSEDGMAWLLQEARGALIQNVIFVLKKNLLVTYNRKKCENFLLASLSLYYYSCYFKISS